MSDETMIGQKPEVPQIDMKALAASAKYKQYLLVFPLSNALKAVQFTALNLISLYGVLLTILPALGIPRFCVLSGDGKELLADASLPEMMATIQGILSAEIVVPDGVATQRALAAGNSAMKGGAR